MREPYQRARSGETPSLGGSGERPRPSRLAIDRKPLALGLEPGGVQSQPFVLARRQPERLR